MPSFARLSAQVGHERSYSTWAYRKMRRAYLTLHPNCERCGGIAAELHHKAKTRLGGAVLDYANFEALCRPCHKAAD